MTRTFKPGDLVRDREPVAATGLWRVVDMTHGNLWRCAPVCGLALGYRHPQMYRTNQDIELDVTAMLLVKIKRHRSHE